ncbi:(2R3R)-3-methylornithine synthase involved in pyrrolysine biosynthesis PylB [Methanonatronarchaeum thermophilum]|uniref:(2R3R)-3-methylornithine synthase involved in pyrrolysine biosynthesis PylB n=1 Tax=Methanonatronarchaeum thermophilum TaxID=1927129 RepID=A0A1Y3GE58_9EURY|nr:hypothetical protein [Methanonatronarchaeum thermophilum]OUJ19497.1 (2R3R)-3-methylornithine synthase involved in pyrrolysine biosynthesis PylB [Methanonatronarchaeum thermophilum]
MKNQKTKNNTETSKILQKPPTQLTEQDTEKLQNIEINTPEYYQLINKANQLTRNQFNNQGEVYGQIGINIKPCPEKCQFCNLAEDYTPFTENHELTPNQVVKKAIKFEQQGVNAIFLMTTADYPFQKYIEIAEKVRQNISPKLPLVANIGDFNQKQAQKLVETGFQGAYHVHRLREGEDTDINPQKRIKTLKAIKNSELDLSYCVEPIGNEHTPQEITKEIYRGIEYNAVNHACMWRQPPKKGPKSNTQRITQQKLAKTIAITRLTTNNTIDAMGVHEPTLIPLIAGANQIYAETGPNPRDTQKDTSKGRGYTPKQARQLLKKAGHKPLKGPTKVFKFKQKIKT